MVAEAVTGLDLTTLSRSPRIDHLDSALHAPQASFGGQELYPVCFWEDDGQDDHHADEVRGGPNYTLSLTEARANYAGGFKGWSQRPVWCGLRVVGPGGRRRRATSTPLVPLRSWGPSPHQVQSFCSQSRLGPIQNVPLTWWGRWGSNPRPRDYESRALTTELLPRVRRSGRCPQVHPGLRAYLSRAPDSALRGLTFDPYRMTARSSSP